MSTTHRATSRALIRGAAAAAATSLALIAGAVPASAHVHVESDDAAPGSTSVVTFRVPNESEKGASTTVFSVALPNVASAATEVMPGWTARLDRDAAAGTVRSVTWTAAPSGGIPADQFALFNVSMTLPNQPTVTLPATQTYSDGTVVRWDQPPLPNGDEPEHPAPELNLAGGGAAEAPDDHQQTPTAAASPPTAAPATASATAPTAAPDDTARWLAGGALVLAAVAAVVALLGRRRA